MPSKKPDLKLYADECFPLTSVTYLKSKGVSIKHAIELKAIGKNDEDHLKNSKKLKRTLITLDRDFIYYDKVSLANHPGVIIISLGSATWINVNKICDKVLPKINNEMVKNSLIKITMNKITKIKRGKVIFEKVF